MYCTEYVELVLWASIDSNNPRCWQWTGGPYILRRFKIARRHAITVVEPRRASRAPDASKVAAMAMAPHSAASSHVVAWRSPALTGAHLLDTRNPYSARRLQLDRLPCTPGMAE